MAIQLVIPSNLRIKIKEQAIKIPSNLVVLDLKAITYGADYFSGSNTSGYTNYTDIQKWMPGIADDIEKIYGSVNGLKILDVGCAFGYLTNELASRGADITGLDSSVYAISQAEALFPSLTFVNESMDSQSERNNIYDMIVALGVFDCVSGSAYTDSMKELNRVGKNNVDVYVLTSSKSNWYKTRNTITWQSTLGTEFGGLWIVENVGDQSVLYDWRIIKAG